MTYEELKKLPKLELHCHLDGSLSREYVSNVIGREVNIDELQISDNCKNLTEYLEKFNLPVQCLQDEAGLKDAAYDFMETCAAENIKYIEVRFAPALSMQKGLSLEQVIESVLIGLEEGKRKFDIDYNIIVCAMRHLSFEENLKMLKASRSYFGKGVCGADLAGDESVFLMTGYMELFDQAKQMGFPFTVHAGECGNAENIRSSIAAGARRIGHGIAMRGEKELQALCREKQIGIELCPVSNMQTRAVSRMEDYPIREFLQNGLCVTINTDNRMVSGTSVTKELMFLQKQYGITDQEIIVMLKNAVNGSFASDQVKKKLIGFYENWNL